MTNLPAWALAFRDDPQLLTELGLRWLDQDEQAATRELWRSTWNQVPYGEDFHARCASRLERAIPLAEGQARHRRLGKAASRLVLVLDPDEPDVAWLSLSHAMPSLSWAVGGSSADELRRSVAFYGQASDGDVASFARTERLVKPIDVESFEVIKRSIEGLELWLDDATWGSAFVDDPWRSLDPEAGMMMLSLHLRRVNEQHPGRRPSCSYRSLWSRSVLTIEQHPFGLWVFELKYQPAADARALEKLTGSEPGTRLPPDLPVDLAASLMRGDSVTREGLHNAEPREASVYDLAVRCAIDPGEATTIAKLRHAIDAWANDERLQGLVDVLHANDHTSLMFEAAVTAGDAELREQLQSFLEPAGDAMEEEVAS